MHTRQPFRPPAVPLVTHDPYFSIWSTHDRLTDGPTTHWTGRWHRIAGIARIDGKAFRFCGPEPRELEAMEQRSRVVTATATTFVFAAAGVQLTVSFRSPLLCDDLALLSRPVTYLTFSTASSDGREHEVALHLDANAEIAVDHSSQWVGWARYDLGEVAAVRLGVSDQRPLHRSGDDLRIDWGWLYFAVDGRQRCALGLGAGEALREAFIAGGATPSDDLDMPRPACDRCPVIAARFELGSVGERAVESCLMVAYDDIESAEFLRRRLCAYWRDGRTGFGDLLRTAARERSEVLGRCEAFDRELARACTAGGGLDLGDIAILAYRQCIAAHKLVRDVDGEPYFLSKENFSNGCIATVDVTFPSSPLFLLLNARLARAMLEPVLRYAATAAWRFPFAPHDLGVYPLANGQVYGGGETSERDQMPIEESGNVLILAAAIAEVEGDAAFAARHWPLLERWATYVRDLGFDPPNQLCTDDFAGHMPGNCNLSLKAIIGLGAFARLCERRGLAEHARAWRAVAEDFAARWQRLALDGDHYRLGFAQPGTWSQKYNLVWDRVLDLRLFPREVAASEVRHYRAKLNPFGLPLDSRHTYTTIDHVAWCAALADDDEELRELIAPCREYLSTTPDRVPLSDWFDTVTARRVGFQARSVVGGLFMPLMRDRARWQPWIERQRHARTERTAVAARA